MANEISKKLAVVPAACAMWAQESPRPELEIIKRYSPEDYSVQADDSSRSLRRCTECGQLYFYQMVEMIDMEDGQDPIYRTYIPVESEEDADKLSVASEAELYENVPRIMYSWPKGEESSIGWVKE